MLHSWLRVQHYEVKYLSKNYLPNDCDCDCDCPRGGLVVTARRAPFTTRLSFGTDAIVCVSCQENTSCRQVIAGIISFECALILTGRNRSTRGKTNLPQCHFLQDKSYTLWSWFLFCSCFLFLSYVLSFSFILYFYIICPLVTYSSKTHNMNIHVSGVIRTRNPSKRAAAEPRLKPLGHWGPQIESSLLRR